MQKKVTKLHNTKLVPYSQQLRKSMTKEERKLWYGFLRSQKVTFRRQKIIGEYIVDFYCSKAKLVIELDGSQHYEEKGRQSDIQRDNYLASFGIRVLRYSNRDINERFEQVCLDIATKAGLV